MFRVTVIFFVLICLMSDNGYAVGVSVEAQVDRTEITIGDLINLDVTIAADTTLEVILPKMDVLLGVFEVKDYNQADPFIDKDGRRIHRYQYNLTTWTTGLWLIPPLTASFTDSAGNAATASSDSIFINVKSLLAEAGADTVDIRDIKAQYEVPSDRAKYYYLAAAAVVAILAVWYFLRRRKFVIKPAAVDLRTPDQRAIDELTELNNAGYLALGKWREWYFALTEIFRRYLDGRYGVETLEATTGEVRGILQDMPFSSPEQREIMEFLEAADWVKFAKLVPPENKPRDDFQWVWQFVQRTRIEKITGEEITAGITKTGTTG